MNNPFEVINERLGNIETLLLDIKHTPKLPSSQQHAETKDWFNLTELCNYLPDKPAKATVYGWLHANIIPCNKGQKKLRLQKFEIDNWLKQGRKKTTLKNHWLKKWGKTIIDLIIQVIKLIIAIVG
jgi:hypothetical protein